MGAAKFTIIATVLLALAGCKSDAPKMALMSGADPLTTGAIPRTAFEVEPGVDAWFRDRGAVLPTGETLAYCHGFGCEFKTAIPMGGDELAALSAIMERRHGSPEEERAAVNLADQWWERNAAPKLGGSLDKRGSDLADAHKPGQTDCIDEATNTTTLLVYMERKGLLKYHHVQRPESRGAFLYAHATAVMTDRTTGIDWVVDSWMRDSGDPIDVMTLDTWFSRAYVDPTS